MSDIITPVTSSATDVFALEDDPTIEESPRSVSRNVRLARRLALVLFVFSFGSFVFGAIFAPIVHGRQSAMLEEKLASDLLNGVTPVSYPIAVGAPVALIEVQSRDLRAVVVEGSTARELSKAAGHLIGSALPGQPGVSAILGRSRNHGAEFANLDRVAVGDEITATTGQGAHTYEVIDVTTRSSRDMAAFQGEGHMLILSTMLDDSDRLVVRASLTSSVFPAGEPANHTTTTEELGTSGDTGSWGAVARWMFLAALVAILVPVILAQVGRRVGWMIVVPIAMWIVVEVWSALSLTGPGSL
ncbi:MAG: sortase [Ilumatobacteraceae bacterium]